MELFEAVGARVAKLLESQRRVSVGIDGPDAAGKTTFADNLAEHMSLPVVRVSIDSFHNPAAVRKQRGELSPEGLSDAVDDTPGHTQSAMLPTPLPRTLSSP